MNHTIRPYFKSLYNECYNKYWGNILPSFTAFRNVNNYNIYIVDYYQNKLNKEINKLTVGVAYLNNNATDEEIESVLNTETDTISLFDIEEEADIYTNSIFINYLNNKFPTISKYEKGE